MKYPLAYLFLSCLLPAGLAFAQGATTLSQRLLELSGRKAGICSMPRCGDGTLAVELARNSTLLVHALSENPTAMAAARKTADEAGLLGLTVYVEEGGVAKNPLANWCADLLIVTDATDADLKQIAQKEVRRVLAPYRGVAIVGRAKTRGAGLTRAKLEAWLNGLGVPGGKVVADDFGLWAVATMPPLAGGDDWTHYAHGPDQNRYSRDDVLKWPCWLQWTSKPYFDGKFDITVAAGGRLFRANATLAIDQTKTDGITARSAYNGHLLWQRKTADDFGTFGSLIVATPEVVYLKDGNGVLCLDAETGAVRKRLVFSHDPQRECRWLMLQEGILVAVLGQRPPVKSLRTYPADTHKGSGGNFPIEQQWFENYDLGSELAAFDASTGRQLWRLAANQIDPAKTAITAGRVFFYADRSYASCLDLKTGKTLWKTDSPIVKDPKGSGWSITFMITERVAALATAEVYLINSFKDGHYQAFAANDGHILWTSGQGRAKPEPSFYGLLGFLILMDEKIFNKDCRYLDPLTGRPTGERLPPLDWGTCGPFCATPHGIYGGGGPVYDRDAQAPIQTQFRGLLGVKTACLSGPIAANGALFLDHGNCSGCVEWYGHITFSPAGGISPTHAAARLDRLLNGKAVGQTEVQSAPLDWTTYKAKNSRCGSSAATVLGKVTTVWVWTPNYPFDAKAEINQGLELQSTQPISAGDRVFFGTAGGMIRCLDRKTGRELWNYPTAGRVLSSPTFWEGKLYSGSGDGHVYCLNAADGSLAWRYRVAPVERRIMVYSHLMSAWPVNANVLVGPSTVAGKSGAVAYATAGLMGPVGGTYICALDARSGEPLWETPLCEPASAVAAGKEPAPQQADGDHGAPQGMSTHALPSATGQMAWHDGILWLHAGDSGVFIVDPATGKVAPAINFNQLKKSKSESPELMRLSTYRGCRGQDIGILPGGWVALGGKEIYWPADEIGQRINGCEFIRTNPEAVPNGSTGYPDVLTFVKDPYHTYCGDAIPVWDEKETVLLGMGPEPVLFSGFDGFLAACADANPLRASQISRGLQHVINNPAWPADRQRSLKFKNCFAPLLARNAVIFLAYDGWRLMAVSRTDASLLWQVSLPAQPVSGGLSMTRGGSVLVPLLDGRLMCIGDEREGVSLRPPAAAPANTAPGLLVRYADAESGATIETEQAPSFPIVASKRAKPYLLRIDGLLKVAEPGKYIMSLQNLKADTEGRLDIDGMQEAVASYWASGTTGDLWLAAGNHAISISAPCSGAGVEKFILRWQRPGKDKPEDIDATCILRPKLTSRPTVVSPQPRAK
jgi:outer membrane protein assembly factor BamB